MSLKNITVAFALLMIIVTACKDPWDDVNKVNNTVLAANLMQLIDKNPDLTKFRDLLIKTGYDKVISSSKTYTVWAPTNDHIEEVLARLSTDQSDSSLARFVSYHIAQQSFLSRNAADTSIRVITLNGKAVELTKTAVEDASIIQGDQYTGNGVLNVIDHPLVAKSSIWESFQNLDGEVSADRQKSFINSWKVTSFDVNNSTQTGVNEQGQPVYDSVFVTEHGFLKTVADVREERRLYTFFVLSDNAYIEEYNKLNKYFADSTDAAISFRTQSFIVKDLVVKGRYDADHLPAALYSNDSTRFTIDKSAIVRSIQTSNGIIHVVNAVSYQMKDKVRPIYIQGEAYNGINPSTISLTKRKRKAPDGTIFTDIMNNTHTTNGVWVSFAPTAFSGTYKVYWRMVRDFSLVPASGATDIIHFPQKVTWNERWKTPAGTIFDPLGSTGLGYKNESFIANPNGTFSPDYSEVLVGEMTIDRYGTLDLYLVANRTASALQNSILLDYIRLEPVY